jgi:hypothetical protein
VPRNRHRTKHALSLLRGVVPQMRGEQIRRRLAKAFDEVNEFEQYEYVVVNDELTAAVDRLRAIVLAERARVKSMRGVAGQIIGTFEGSVKAADVTGT